MDDSSDDDQIITRSSPQVSLSNEVTPLSEAPLLSHLKGLSLEGRRAALMRCCGPRSALSLRVVLACWRPSGLPVNGDTGLFCRWRCSCHCCCISSF